jgi:hypothetical protein
VRGPALRKALTRTRNRPLYHLFVNHRRADVIACAFTCPVAGDALDPPFEVLARFAGRYLPFFTTRLIAGRQQADAVYRARRYA